MPEYRLRLLVITIIYLAQPAFAQEPLVIQDRAIAGFGDVIRENPPRSIRPTSAGTGIIYSDIQRVNKGSAFRFHFVVDTPSQTPSSWTISILDQYGKPVWDYSPDSTDIKSFWSDEVVGNICTVIIYSTIPGNTIRLMIDIIAIDGPPIKEQAQVGPTWDLVRVLQHPDDRVKAWGKSIARLRSVNDTTGRQNYCTGFLVSEDLFITNEHCINDLNRSCNDSPKWRSIMVDFDYDYEIPRRELKPLRFEELILCDFELDFALLRLNKKLARTFIDLKSSAAVTESTSRLMVIQHPTGEPKQAPDKNCEVEAREVSGRIKDNQSRLIDFAHTCDSERGSSGAPVQDLASGALVGLHHVGTALGNNNQFVNRAVRIEKILSFIRSAPKNEKISKAITELKIQ